MSETTRIILVTTKFPADVPDRLNKNSTLVGSTYSAITGFAGHFMAAVTVDLLLIAVTGPGAVADALVQVSRLGRHEHAASIFDTMADAISELERTYGDDLTEFPPLDEVTLTFSKSEVLSIANDLHYSSVASGGMVGPRLTGAQKFHDAAAVIVQAIPAEVREAQSAGA